MQPPFLSVSNDRRKTKVDINLHARIGDLLTIILFTVLKGLVIDVFVVIILIDKHLLVIVLDEQKIAFQHLTPVATVEQQDRFANSDITKIMRTMQI